MFLIDQFKTHVVGALKNSLIKTILLSTHNICFGTEIHFQITQPYLDANHVLVMHIGWPDTHRYMKR